MPEKVSLSAQRIRQRLVALDVLLRSVHDTDKAKLQRIYTPGENVHGVCTMVHEIQFGENTNRPFAHGVHMSGQLECF